MLVSVGEKVKFISSVFGKVQVGSSGEELAVRCPFPECPSQKKKEKFKLAIRVADDFCHCWVCSFRARSLLPLIFKFGTREQLVEYKQKFLPEHVISTKKYDVDQMQSRLSLPQTFKLLALETESSDWECRRAINYLFKERGLSERDLWFYKFVITDDWKWKKRVIFPSFDSDGTLNYYAGRLVEKLDGWNKYKNCEVDSESIVFNEINVDWKKPLVLVEGPFDLVKCTMNATCMLGSNLHENHELFNRILYYQTPVILCLDSDMKDKTQRIARKLSQYNVDVKIASLADSKDPGSMKPEELQAVIDAAKPWNWNDFMLQRIRRIKTKLFV